MIANPVNCPPSQMEMTPHRALALALLVIDEHIEFTPTPETAKARQATWEWLAEVRAARYKIARMMTEMGENGRAR